jgi:cytochrome c oxidase subunit 2
MYKWTMFVLFVGASLFGLLVLMFQTPEGAEHAAPPKDDELRITASNFQFDQQEYRVKVGETKTVTLVNVAGTHGVEIKGLDIKLENDQLSQEVTFDKPGEYELACSILCGAGHLDMVSKLIVEE